MSYGCIYGTFKDSNRDLELQLLRTVYFMWKLFYYCEQGIDVVYAQKGENIVRASCVGCGICSLVCPRGA